MAHPTRRGRECGGKVSIGEAWKTQFKQRHEGMNNRVIRLLLSRFSCVWFFATLWTAACQTLLSMGFSRQEYWSRLPFFTPGDLPDPGIKSTSLACPALAGRSFMTMLLWKLICSYTIFNIYCHIMNYPKIWWLKTTTIYYLTASESQEFQSDLAGWFLAQGFLWGYGQDTSQGCIICRLG